MAGCKRTGAGIQRDQRPTNKSFTNLFDFVHCTHPFQSTIHYIMKLSEIQQLVAEFVSENSLDTSLEFRLLDLVSETGELAKEFLKSTSYGRDQFIADQEWSKEIGDVFFALLCVANLTDTDLHRAVKGSLAKYSQRISLQGTPDSGR